MIEANRSKIKSFDWFLFIATVLLFVVGISTIYSTVLAGEGQSSSLVTKQILAFVLGMLGFLVITWIDIKYIYYVTPVLYILSILILIALLLFSDPIRGIKGWFVIGPVQIQPAEFVKLSVAFSLAAYVQFMDTKMATWKGLLGGLGLLGAPLLLVTIQPDLGTALVMFVMGMVIIFFSAVDFKKLAAMGFILLLLSPLLYANLADYQKARITSFMSPSDDPLGSGYNQIQSIIAVGSGQLTGRGWGKGTQSHLRFLPEQHTDFIFATFAEEFGLIGSGVVLLLFGIVIARAVMIAVQSNDTFSFMVVMSVVMFVFTHLIINIGMNIGILPVAGIPLPLMSYGGSSLIVTLIAIGCIESVAIRRRN